MTPILLSVYIFITELYFNLCPININLKNINIYKYDLLKNLLDLKQLISYRGFNNFKQNNIVEKRKFYIWYYSTYY